jgi:sialidase-1
MQVRYRRTDRAARRTRLATVAAAILAALALTATTGTHTGHATTPTSSVIDTSGTPASQYRITSDALTNDGTLIACYDSRNLSSADLPNDIDVVCKRSTDQGATWSTRVAAVAHTGGNTQSTAYGVGDPSLLYDHNNGRLYLWYLAAPPGVGLSNSSTGTSATDLTTVHPRYTYSDNDGVTWATPIDETSALKTTAMTGIFASSGNGTQLANGTLVQPFVFFVSGVSTAALAYSTDHGATWHMGSTIGTNIGEHHVAQLDNGTLLDDARSANILYRVLSTALTVTGTWSTPTANHGMPDPQCNGDILAVPGSTQLLASNADSQTARENGVVRLSTDNGATWRAGWSVTTAPYWAFGYSSMVRFADGTYGIMYEHTVADNGGSLVFTHFDFTVFPQ